MRPVWILAACTASLSLVSCASHELDGRDICTLKAIGDETGAASIRVELSIPKAAISGAEISNGGVTVMYPGCDFPINAFLAHDTSEAIIAQAVSFPEHRPFLSTATAELFVWRFRDGSEKPRFFVTSYHDMKPVDHVGAGQTSESRAE